MTSIFTSITLDGVTLLFRISNLRNACKCFYYSQSSWRDFFSCNAENWKQQKDSLAFSSFLVSYNRNRVLLTSDLLSNISLVKKRKLRLFGHVSRSSGLAKTILQGTVKGKRKRGRQKKRWEDNIKEWTGMDFASSTRAAENRSRWKGVVANSSVVPRRPSKVMG